MCHQSVGLIARQIEAQGIPTICVSSAYSITASVNPPRAAFVDFPLGHTTGKPHDRVGQRKLMIDVLSALDGIQIPGTIQRLKYRWSDDDAWKDTAMRPRKGAATSDDRQTRWAEPQYQYPDDERAAAQSLATDGCPSCVWLADPK